MDPGVCILTPPTPTPQPCGGSKAGGLPEAHRDAAFGPPAWAEIWGKDWRVQPSCLLTCTWPQQDPTCHLSAPSSGWKPLPVFWGAGRLGQGCTEDDLSRDWPSLPQGCPRRRQAQLFSSLYRLSDLGQVTGPLRTSVSSSLQRQPCMKNVSLSELTLARGLAVPST